MRISATSGIYTPVAFEKRKRANGNQKKQYKTETSLDWNDDAGWPCGWGKKISILNNRITISHDSYDRDFIPAYEEITKQVAQMLALETSRKERFTITAKEEHDYYRDSKSLIIRIDDENNGKSYEREVITCGYFSRGKYPSFYDGEYYYHAKSCLSDTEKEKTIKLFEELAGQVLAPYRARNMIESNPGINNGKIQMDDKAVESLLPIISDKKSYESLKTGLEHMAERLNNETPDNKTFSISTHSSGVGILEHVTGSPMGIYITDGSLYVTLTDNETKKQYTDGVSFSYTAQGRKIADSKIFESITDQYFEDCPPANSSRIWNERSL